MASNFTSSFDYDDIPIFEGTERVLATIQLIVISLVSIALHGIFLLGIRRLCGWGSDFAFTILFCISICSLIRLLCEIIAVSLSTSKLNMNNSERIWRIIGSLCIAPNFALVILHVALAVHRLGYTLFPIKAHLILKLWMLKTLLSLVFFYFIVVIALTQTDLMGIAFLPSTMCLIIMDMQYSNILYEINRGGNYLTVIMHVIIYPFLFIVLFLSRNYTLKNNKEIRMTIQVFTMVFFELVFFVYWEFSGADDDVYSVWLSENSNLIYFDALILPYLALNKSIHSQLRNIYQKPATKISVSSIHQKEQENGAWITSDFLLLLTNFKVAEVEKQREIYYI